MVAGGFQKVEGGALLDLLPLAHELLLDEVVVLPDALGVLWVMEEDEEGQPLLRQLLRVLKGDLPDHRVALLLHPGQEGVVVPQVPGEGLVLLVGPLLGRPEGHNVMAGRVQLLHYRAETCQEKGVRKEEQEEQEEQEQLVQEKREIDSKTNPLQSCKIPSRREKLS